MLFLLVLVLTLSLKKNFFGDRNRKRRRVGRKRTFRGLLQVRNFKGELEIAGRSCYEIGRAHV